MEKQIEKFIIKTVGCDSLRDIEFIDEFLESFELDVFDAINEDELFEAILHGMNPRFPFPLNVAIKSMFEHVIKQSFVNYEDDYDINESMFSYYINSVYSSLYVNDIEVHSWDDITDAIKIYKRKSDD